MLHIYKTNSTKVYGTYNYKLNFYLHLRLLRPIQQSTNLSKNHYRPIVIVQFQMSSNANIKNGFVESDTRRPNWRMQFRPELNSPPSSTPSSLS